MRDQYTCLYTSSYDRGLEHLLKMWPDVKKAVPKAELHVFYGWQLFEGFYKDNPASMSWKNKMDKQMEQPGVTHHGRIPQPEIEEWYKKCALWTYPTHFGEISCISAMKAQAWGSIPVVMDYAALSTTVQHGVKVEGDIYDEEAQEAYKKALIKALKDNGWQNEVRKPMMEWAQKKFSWTQVAQQWGDDFRTDELKESMDIILKANPEAEKFMPVQLQEKYGLKQTW